MVTFTTKVVGGLHSKGQIQDIVLAPYRGKEVFVTVTEEDRPKPKPEG